MTESERVICKEYLKDLDKYGTCNEYKLLMELINRDAIYEHIYEQIKLERDVAIDQLKTLGYGLGEKVKISEDAISREAVHEAIEKWAESMSVLIALPIREIRPLLDSIHKLPPVNPQLKWIPVSERLPKEREWYLAVFKEKDTAYQLIPRVADYIGNGENKWRIIDEYGLRQEYRDKLECIAWLPLPAPFEPQESEDKE